MSVRLIVAGSALAASALLMSGCQSIGAASGAVAGVATGAVTTNPAVGIGVGIAVQAATDAAVNRTMKRLHQDQQDAIASLVGITPVDGTQTWRVKHWLPVENGHGRIRVTRAFASAIALCKDFVFSVADGDDPNAREDWYTATACEAPQGWKWASAEPAVARWGNLQ
ncbi:MAG TPA: hypothetical protein VKS80_08930 [Trinickia sp.]|nr:hypothetical protein [Trinickia sp.]